jgi:nicotinamidase-related amidase
MTTIDVSRTAFVPMDFQNAIVAMAPDPDGIVERVRTAVDAMRAAGGTVAHVRVGLADEDFVGIPETSGMGKRAAAMGDAFKADSPGTQIVERLAPQDGDIVVRKTRVGALSTTDLAAQLRARGVDTLVLAGISTSGCVLSTVRDAFDQDFRVLVVSDGCIDPVPEIHDALINLILPRQAEILTIEEFLSAIR